MNNNSVIILETENPIFKTPEYILQQDPFESYDIGWVDQMLPLIESYTKHHHNVLDIFSGLGSTAIAAKILNRNAFMIEINTQRSALIQQRWSVLQTENLAELSVFNQDCLSFLKTYSELPPIQLSLTNTPYFSQTSCLNHNLGLNLYNISDYHTYLMYIEYCLIELRKHLAGGATCIMTCENIRDEHGELIPMAWDIAKLMQKHYTIFDEKIFYYPNTHRITQSDLQSNRQHEYIFIAKKYLTLEQCKILNQLLNSFKNLNLKFSVLGTFKKFINNIDARHIGDLDLQIPCDKDNLYTLLCDLHQKFIFKIWSWNNALDFRNFSQWDFQKIYDNHYLRLMLFVDNDSIQIDLKFDQ